MKIGYVCYANYYMAIEIRQVTKLTRVSSTGAAIACTPRVTIDTLTGLISGTRRNH
jgi:hypothetical protein